MEITFERGGKLPEKKSKLLKKTTFGAKNEEIEEKSKRDKKKNNKNAKNKDETLEIKSANVLTLSSLVPDMILMGIIKAVHSDRLLVRLPGRLFGRVPITHISKAYTEFLSSTLDGEDLLDKPKGLSEMFHVGQILYTKVLDKCHGEKQEILLSLLPEDVNSELSNSMLAKGNVILCAIQEVEDHGYFLETGIKGIRGFMPKKNSKVELKVGELVFSKVNKITDSIVTFTSFKKSEQIRVDTEDVPNIKTLMPSTFVNFNVVAALKNGIEGLLFDGSITAYANELYIPPKLFSDPKLIGKELKARILYRMPLSNQLYVTLNIEEPTNERIVFGTIIESAKVVKQTSNGVIFKVDSSDYAFLTRKSIMSNYKNNFDIDAAMLKFSPNTTHKIRIMDYNEFENCYLCTNNEKLLNEKYFGTYSLHIGQIVDAKIIEKHLDGLKLLIGSVKGYLKGVFYHKTAKCEVGALIKVRITEIDHNEKFVIVTNLQGFLRDNCKILATKEKLKIGDSFAGVVINENEKCFTILFFNHVRGLLLKNQNSEEDLISIGGLKIGSVKLFQIERVKGNLIFLKASKKVETENLGKIYECKVTSILPTSGLQVFINDLKSYGKVPIHMLSEFSSLNETILSSMRENTKFKVVALGNNQYSRRDVKYFSQNVPADFKDIKPDDVLRCYVKSINADNIELECPIKNFNDTIRLSRNAFDDPDTLILNIGDIIYVNVIAKNESHANSLYVTPSLTKVWISNKDSLDMLSNYLDDISFLIENLKELDKPFGKYSIGQRVSGTVKNIIGNNILIEMDDNVYAQGTVDNVHAFKIGTKINEAVVCWMDPINQMLFVTTIEKCKDEISMEQAVDEKLVCEKKHKAIIVYFNEYVTVCTIRKQCQPLVYVPSKHHYNDFSTDKNNRALGNARSKLVIKAITCGKLMGCFVQDSKVFQKLDKIKQKLDRKNPISKRKLKNSISESLCEEEIIKHPKVVLDEESDDEYEQNIQQKDVLRSKMSKQAKHTMNTIGKKIKKTANKSIPGKKYLINKDSLLDDDLVNLVSYKKLKDGQATSIVEKKHEKSISKSTIGKKKPKRLVKKGNN